MVTGPVPRRRSIPFANLANAETETKSRLCRQRLAIEPAAESGDDVFGERLAGGGALEGIAIRAELLFELAPVAAARPDSTLANPEQLIADLLEMGCQGGRAAGALAAGPP
jgi:hypothetical protein